MYACQMEKSKSGIICVVKNRSKKVSETHFQKVLKRQKSANSTIQKVLIRQKDAQTTIIYKTLYFNRKSFCNILGARMAFITFGDDKDNEFKFI